MTEKEIKGAAPETPEDKFKRLATLRVNNALDKIRLIGNLSGADYRYTGEQAQKIIESLKTAVQEVENRFSKTAAKKEQNFSL